MPEKKKEALLSLLAARFFAYNLLKRVFLEEPSKDFLEIIAKDKLLDFFPGRENRGLVKTGSELTGGYLKEVSIDENIVNDLVADYNHLFVIAQKKSEKITPLGMRDNAPPYESVYRAKKPLVFQEETMKVRREYMKHGLLPKNFMQEPDDHIAFELDFMGHLIKTALDHLEKDKVKETKEFLKTQERFLQEHLLKWVPIFSTQMEKTAQTDFYRGFAKMLDGFLKWDGKQLPKLLEQLGQLKKPASK